MLEGFDRRAAARALSRGSSPFIDATRIPAEPASALKVYHFPGLLE
jgi:hypothetical protein